MYYFMGSRYHKVREPLHYGLFYFLTNAQKLPCLNVLPSSVARIVRSLKYFNVDCERDILKSLHCNADIISCMRFWCLTSYRLLIAFWANFILELLMFSWLRRRSAYTGLSTLILLFQCVLFVGYFTMLRHLDYLASNRRMTDELESTRKETTVAL
jgi:hypothetical protein